MGEIGVAQIWMSTCSINISWTYMQTGIQSTLNMFIFLSFVEITRRYAFRKNVWRKCVKLRSLHIDFTKKNCTGCWINGREVKAGKSKNQNRIVGVLAQIMNMWIAKPDLSCYKPGAESNSDQACLSFANVIHYLIKSSLDFSYMERRRKVIKLFNSAKISPSSHTS